MRILLVKMVLVLILAVAADAAEPAKSVRIGVATSFLVDQPKAFAQIATDEFKAGMKKITGFDGGIAKFDAFDVAEKLDAKKLDVGIFHAHELAWVQKRYPDLEPILIAAGKHKAERVYLIVTQKNAAKTFADLGGKKLDLPLGSTAYARLFLGKRAAANQAKSVDSFFNSVAKSASRFDALDQVARGKVDATVIDQTSLDFYKEVKPAVFANNLRVLDQSEEFPPVAVVAKKGGLAPAAVKQFRDGLFKADETAEGRELMKTWNIQAFEPVPKDYAEKLAKVSKEYPAPTR